MTKGKRDEANLVEEDRELAAFFNEIHFVEYDRFGSSKKRVSFSQFKLCGDKLSQMSQILPNVVGTVSVNLQDSPDL